MINYRAYLDALLSLPAFEWADDEWRMWQSLYRAACAQVARVPITDLPLLLAAGERRVREAVRVKEAA